MSTSLLDLLIITTICLSVYNGVGLAFNIEISPDKVNGLVHNEVNIVCKLETSDGRVREIMLLELSKDGERIAVLRQNSKLSIRKGMEKKYQAKGTVSQSDVLDSYLHVTLKNPRVENSGPYTCQLYSIDELAVLTETRATGNLTVSDEDIKTVVMNLVEKVSTLEKEHCDRISTLKESHNETNYQLGRQLDFQKNETLANQELISKLKTELKEQKDIHRYDVEQLQNKISEQKIEPSDQISALERKLDEHEQRIKTLIEKEINILLDVQKNETLTNQERISKLETELKEQKDTHKNYVEQLQNKISKQKSESSDEISALERKLDKQEQRIQNLIEKDIDIDGLFDVQKNETLANQELISKLKFELKEQKDVHKYDVEQLQNKVNKQKGDPSDEISVLEGKLDKQEQRIQSLIEKDIDALLDVQKNETLANQELISKLKRELKEQKEIHKYDVEQLQNQISKQKSESSEEISALEGKLDKQEQCIQNLIEKDIDMDGLFDVQKNETQANQELISELKTELKEQKDVHKYDVEQLQNKVNKQKNEPSDEISVLEGKLDKQEQRIQNLIEKENTTVFFTAWHTRAGSFQIGADMVYRDVVENVGGAYDGSTGKFKAPVDGLYFFDVSVASKTGTGILIDLKTSDGRLLTRLWDYDGQRDSYSDSSCVTKLYAGEYVHPFVRGVSGGYSMEYWDIMDPVNKFYGVLIKTL